jgi:hypothetical protein
VFLSGSARPTAGSPAHDREIVMSMLIARATWLLDLRAIAVALATVAGPGTPW